MNIYRVFNEKSNPAHGTSLTSNVSQIPNIVNDFVNDLPIKRLLKSKGFKVAHLNIASIPMHLDELKVLMKDKPVDVLSINETRLDDTIDNEEVRIPGYNIFCKDRFRNGGGVALYIREVFNVSERTKLVPSYLEAVCIEVKKPKSKPIIITTVYRPPSSKIDYMNQIEDYLNVLDNENKELIVMGDFNCDLSKGVLQAHSDQLKNILSLLQLEQIINEPTRITVDHESLIDIIATNRPDKLLGSGVLHLGISDHSLVYGCFKISIPKEKPKFVETRSFKNYNLQAFNADLLLALSRQNWNFDDPNQSW